MIRVNRVEEKEETIEMEEEDYKCSFPVKSFHNSNTETKYAPDTISDVSNNKWCYPRNRQEEEKENNYTHDFFYYSSDDSEEDEEYNNLWIRNNSLRERQIQMNGCIDYDSGLDSSKYYSNE